MIRFRHCVALTLAAIGVAACGASTSTVKPKSTASTTTVAAHSHDMSKMGSHDMSKMKPAVVPKALAVRADGTFDPAKIDLGGVAGVTAKQQKSAEALLRNTVNVLPHWNDVETARKEGFHSIGDALTGDEHWIHWDWINDKTMLDPHKPEALVYNVDRATQKRTLEAVMFLLPEKYTFNNLPDVGGKLIQFHIHDNLCFTDTMPAPQVAGLTNGEGGCNKPLVKFHPNVMMHVWIRPNPCGPFAALEGIGAGQVRPGDTKACDADHGAHL